MPISPLGIIFHFCLCKPQEDIKHIVFVKVPRGVQVQVPERARAGRAIPEPQLLVSREWGNSGALYIPFKGRYRAPCKPFKGFYRVLLPPIP